MENYLLILQDSLVKKLRVLEQLEVCSLKQEAALSEEKASLEEFDALTVEKGQLIEQLQKLDNGFEQLYERVKMQLDVEKDAHHMEIANMKELIRRITEKSVSLQAQEARNKVLVEKFFTKERGQLRQGRLGSKAAMNYYSNMNRMGVNTPQVIDEKN